MNKNLDSITASELKEAFLKLLSEKLHVAIFPVLFPATPASMEIQDGYHKICAKISREAAESFFEAFEKGEK